MFGKILLPCFQLARTLDQHPVSAQDVLKLTVLIWVVVSDFLEIVLIDGYGFSFALNCLILLPIDFQFDLLLLDELSLLRIVNFESGDVAFAFLESCLVHIEVSREVHQLLLDVLVLFTQFPLFDLELQFLLIVLLAFDCELFLGLVHLSAFLQQTCGWCGRVQCRHCWQLLVHISNSNL